MVCPGQCFSEHPLNPALGFFSTGSLKEKKKKKPNKTFECWWGFFSTFTVSFCLWCIVRKSCVLDVIMKTSPLYSCTSIQPSPSLARASAICRSCPEGRRWPGPSRGHSRKWCHGHCFAPGASADSFHLQTDDAVKKCSSLGWYKGKNQVNFWLTFYGCATKLMVVGFEVCFFFITRTILTAKI